MLDGAKTLLYTLFKATCDPDPAFNCKSSIMHLGFVVLPLIRG